MNIRDKLPKGTNIESFNNTKLKYKVMRHIGNGTFGNVFEVKRSKDSTVFAMKVVPLTGYHRKRPKEMIFREEATRLMQVGHHLHIMGLVDVASFDGYGALIMELASEGNLQTVYRQISDEHHTVLSQRVAYEMTEALHFIHSRTPAIVHRDIKPDNILVFLSDTARKPCYLFKLADFGISKTVDDGEEDVALRIVSEPMSGRAYAPYRAPETAKNLGDKHPRGFETKADIYSLGVVLSEIHNNTFGRSSFPSLHKVPAKALPLIKAMLTHDPSKRPLAQDCKRYSWYKEGAAAVVHKSASGSKEGDSLGKSMQHLSIE